MHKRLSILVALAAAAMIAVATVIPAFATSYNNWIPAANFCAGPSGEAIDAYVDLSSAGAQNVVLNTFPPGGGSESAECFGLLVNGYVSFASGGGNQMSGGGQWHEWNPPSVGTAFYYQDNIVVVDETWGVEDNNGNKTGGTWEAPS